MRINRYESHFGRDFMSLLLLVVSAWGASDYALAAATDIAAAPIFTASTATTEVKPNVMFVLDDSGSMDWNYMPDNAANFSGRMGFASSQCNGVYYNPAITYTPPVDAAGNSFANSTFTAAWDDGYGTVTTTTDLSNNFRAYASIGDGSGGTSTGVAAYYYRYTGSQTAAAQKDYYNSSSTFYTECRSSTTSTTAPFTKVTVGASEQQNFANWYSYYRTRMMMMKTASGQAFKTLNSHFRVGFMSLHGNLLSGSSSQKFINISDFDGTQKARWYDRLYSANPNSNTPLREALANAGRIYAGKLTSLNGVTVTDPVQYACQQNFTILSTDGFWNGTDGDVKKINGTTTMDNQDGGLPRPYNDGTLAISTTVTPYTSTVDRQTVTTGATSTKVWTQTTKAIGSACGSTPTNTTSAYLNVGNGNREGALGSSGSNPDSNNTNRCYPLDGNAWFCRGGSNSSPVVSLSSALGAAGTTWYLVSNIGSNSGCVSASTAFGNSYSSTAGVCPGVTGSQVTTTTSTQTQTITSATTRVDRYTATQTTTQTTTNGVAGVVGPLTPTPPVYTMTSNISSTTSTTSDVLAPWTTPVSSTACTATALLPTPGTNTTGPVISTAPGASTTTDVANTATGPTAGTPTTTTSGSGGTSNTLADVAAYYYNTNLRTAALNNCTGPIIAPATTNSNLCLANKVPTTSVDTATWQHMTTFTLGLGARGRMVFTPDYLTSAASDFYFVKQGSTANSTSCLWRDTLTVAGGPCNWPAPGTDQIENIDDLWHAAVNGHGNYFSATNPSDLALALSASLNVIINAPKVGAAAAAATTNPNITAANNFQFATYFKTVEWSGQLIRQTIDLTTQSAPTYNPNNPVLGTYDWGAMELLDTKAYTDRRIFIKGTSGLVDFNWTNLGTVGKQGYFTTPAISTSPPAFPVQLTGLSQFCATGTNCLTSTAQSNNTIASNGAAGEALVNFLRGDRSNEESTTPDPTKFFRHRAHVLGDIVTAQPQYVGAPDKAYVDTGYSAFKTAHANRQDMVYVSGNDGMLHAFNATNGNEEWAYIPSLVLPRMYTLADKSYADKHQYFVEGTPSIGDVYVSGVWKTILVGGLNGGGNGYYALDITDPLNPVYLWEFTDNNMGYTFGNPQITKLDTGAWVVLVTSGYNNCPRLATTAQQNCVKSGVGDGLGRLYVLNAGDGSQLTTAISTAVGSVTAPSGLSKIIAQVDADYVTTRVYGGDLLGNLWRFTLGSGGYSKQLLATFLDASGNAQPITARPQVTTYLAKPIVYVGTGRYLGTTDVNSTLQQSFYGVRDNLGASSFGNPRAGSTFIGLTASSDVCPAGTSVDICQPGSTIRTVTQNGTTNASLSSGGFDGWYLDFPAGVGEQSFTDPKLVLGTLVFSTNSPTSSTSEVCGSATATEPVAMAYQLDYLTGGAVGNNAGIVATALGNGIYTAATIENFGSGGQGKVKGQFRGSTGDVVGTPIRFNSSGNLTRRVSWRELISQ
ncbi:pilus assembly protein [Dechloromonas sp. HYN0024]|uniref:pilus assembly protein n=1 Tax=Dechloromonas sp. HYN0024 TaxID=2231055 RepID=UPI0013C2CAD9|nr:PilC/PilY family type IV pilus protein [Dechloromonas sp. HYN0024]